MKTTHRGASGDISKFGPSFIKARLAGFEKDIDICLTPVKSKTRPGDTHAYFPALGACCGMLEYLAGLYRGDLHGIGWPQIADWAEAFMPQPDYSRDTSRIVFEAFRHPVAHRGIASGVWIDRNRGAGHGRRLTWKVSADSKRPACEVVAEQGQLRRDPPWPCYYTHRVHIRLKGLQVDISRGANRYGHALSADKQLQTHFQACMRQLYPT